MSRTRIVAPALAGAVLVGIAGAPASADAIKIGVINTYSGPDSDVGDMLDRGMELYFKTHQKDLPAGVTLDLVKRDDTGAAPDIAKRLAQELVTRDHVRLITGVVYSPNMMAIGPVATEAKVPVVDMNAATIAAPSKTPFMIRTSFTLTQQALPLGTWAAKQGYKTAYSAVSDYAPGHEGADAFAKGFTAAGGKMVGAVNFPAPPTTPDFAPFLQRVKDAKPDVLYIFVPAGAQATEIMKAARDLDLQKAGVHIISTEDLVPDEQLATIGDQAVGLITSGVYSADAVRPANQAFLEAWYKAGNKMPPDFLSADAWDGMKAIFDLVAATKGEFSGDQAMDFLKSWKNPNSPKGPVMIDPATRDIVQNVYMRKVEKKDGKFVDVETETIGMVNDLGQIVSVAK